MLSSAFDVSERCERAIVLIHAVDCCCRGSSISLGEGNQIAKAFKPRLHLSNHRSSIVTLPQPMRRPQRIDIVVLPPFSLVAP